VEPPGTHDHEFSMTLEQYKSLKENPGSEVNVKEERGGERFVGDFPDEPFARRLRAQSRRMEVERWTDCYPDDEFNHYLEMGIVLDSRIFQERLDGDISQAEAFLAGVIAKTNLFFTKQVGLVLTVKDLVLVQGDAPKPEWDNHDCENHPSNQLEQFKAWPKPSKQALWHLFSDCFSGGTLGIAPLGSMCRGDGGAAVSLWTESRAWRNDGDYPCKNNPKATCYDTTWTTFAHEVGHQIGAGHSFEDNRGIMSYSDHRIDGETQFNTKYRKKEICDRLTLAKEEKCPGFRKIEEVRCIIPGICINVTGLPFAGGAIEAPGVVGWVIVMMALVLSTA